MEGLYLLLSFTCAIVGMLIIIHRCFDKIHNGGDDDGDLGKPILATLAGPEL